MPTSVDLQIAHDAYLANCDYDAVNSYAKAQAFVVACRKLIALLPQRQQHGGVGGESIQFDLSVIRKELEQAKQFAASYPVSGGAGFGYLDISCSREGSSSSRCCE